jgi:prepilin-type processing-associated H-X9-DG protein
VGKTLEYFQYPTHFCLFTDAAPIYWMRGTSTYVTQGTTTYRWADTDLVLGSLDKSVDPPNMGTEGCVGRHNSMVNMGFLDGHAKADKIDDLNTNYDYYFDAWTFDKTMGQGKP